MRDSNNLGCVLLTGATGYIASHTWLALWAAGYEVVGIDNLSNSSPKVLDRLSALEGGRQTHFEHGDVRDADALDRAFALGRSLGGIRAVIHFAALKAVG